jgi:nicotinate phosphoribosyltransferase
MIVQGDEDVDPVGPDLVGYHPLIEYESKRYENITSVEPLLQPVILHGEPTGWLPALPEIRQRTQEQLEQLHPTSRRLLNPHIYKVSISEKTLRIRQELREQMGS